MATTCSTYRLLNDGLPKIFGDWKYDSPLFGPCLLWRNGWMDQDTIFNEGRHRPGDIVLDGDSPPSTERSTAAPTFQPTALARIPTVPHFTLTHIVD